MTLSRYIPMQLGGALLCRRFGSKRVLTYGALLWSTFTALTPLSANHGFGSLLACRIGMGLSEGVAFPSAFHTLAQFVPCAERGRAVSIFVCTSCNFLSDRLVVSHNAHTRLLLTPRAFDYASAYSSLCPFLLSTL
jgi:MFS family permease